MRERAEINILVCVCILTMMTWCYISASAMQHLLCESRSACGGVPRVKGATRSTTISQHLRLAVTGCKRALGVYEYAPRAERLPQDRRRLAPPLRCFRQHSRHILAVQCCTHERHWTSIQVHLLLFTVTSTNDFLFIIYNI
jgi:hypothetical protein